MLSLVSVCFPIIWLYTLSNVSWCGKYFILSPQPWVELSRVAVQRLKCHHIFLIKFTFLASNFFFLWILMTFSFSFWHSLASWHTRQKKSLSLSHEYISTGCKTWSCCFFMIEFYDSSNDIANEYSTRFFLSRFFFLVNIDSEAYMIHAWDIFCLFSKHFFLIFNDFFLV